MDHRRQSVEIIGIVVRVNAGSNKSASSAKDNVLFKTISAKFRRRSVGYREGHDACRMLVWAVLDIGTSGLQRGNQIPTKFVDSIAHHGRIVGPSVSTEQIETGREGVDTDHIH